MCVTLLLGTGMCSVGQGSSKRNMATYQLPHNMSSMSLTPTPVKHFGPLKRGGGGGAGGAGTKKIKIIKSGYIAPAFSGVCNGGTESEVAAQILPSRGPRENGPPKKRSILRMNSWDDPFYEPLQMGHQNFPVHATPANFSILDCTIVRTF